MTLASKAVKRQYHCRTNSSCIFFYCNCTNPPHWNLVDIEVRATIHFRMETQMHTAGPTCVLCFITYNVACNVSTTTATLKYGPIICICSSIIKKTVVLTLVHTLNGHKVHAMSTYYRHTLHTIKICTT